MDSQGMEKRVFFFRFLFSQEQKEEARLKA